MSFAGASKMELNLPIVRIYLRPIPDKGPGSDRVSGQQSLQVGRMDEKAWSLGDIRVHGSHLSRERNLDQSH